MELFVSFINIFIFYWFFYLPKKKKINLESLSNINTMCRKFSTKKLLIYALYIIFICIFNFRFEVKQTIYSQKMLKI